MKSFLNSVIRNPSSKRIYSNVFAIRGSWRLQLDTRAFSSTSAKNHPSPFGGSFLNMKRVTTPFIGFGNQNALQQSQYHVMLYNPPKVESPIPKDIQQLPEIAEFERLVTNEKYKEAIPPLKRSLEILKGANVDQESNLLALQKRLFDLYSKDGQHARAESIAIELLSSVDQDDRKEVFEAERRMISVSKALGKWDVALGFCGGMIEKARKNEDWSFLAGALVEMGNLYILPRYSSRPETAQKCFEQAIQTLDKYDLSATPLKGCAFQAQGNHKLAFEFFDVAQKTLLEVEPDNEDAKGDILANQGEVYLEKGEHSKANELLEEALKLHEKVSQGPNSKVASDLFLLGRNYHQQQHHLYAEGLYKSSIQMYESSGEKAGLRKVLKNFASLLRTSGRSSEASKVEEKLKSSEDEK